MNNTPMSARWSAGRPILPGLLAIACLSGCTESNGEPISVYKTVVEADIPIERERVTRLFWQDRQDASLKWADLSVDESGEKWQLQPTAVAKFPRLDRKKQDLVQMGTVGRTLLVGVRDNDDGDFQSGWIAVDTGVHEQPHGDHSDWIYEAAPAVRCSRLDKEQGNPAHLYVYDGAMFLANDTKNGFTHFVADDFSNACPQGAFHPGGGNHITMAAVDNAVCYSTWIDGGGPNKGRVDVVDVQQSDNTAPAYSFYLPTGVIHGATENSGRVFLAPSDGICWVDADTSLSQNSDSVKVHHIPLGENEEAEKPLRTGAFVNHRNWVLFTTGTADSSALGLLDAAAESPTVIQLAIDVPDGLSLVTPEVVQAQTGKRYAFVFQDRKAGDVQEQLTIVDLDPNGDRDLTDARVAKTMAVGASQVEGHYGHHAICFDPAGTVACLCNPGESSLWMISLETLEVVAKLTVGGTPTAVICTGGGWQH